LSEVLTNPYRYAVTADTLIFSQLVAPTDPRTFDALFGMKNRTAATLDGYLTEATFTLKKTAGDFTVSAFLYNASNEEVEESSNFFSQDDLDEDYDQYSFTFGGTNVVAQNYYIVAGTDPFVSTACILGRTTGSASTVGDWQAGYNETGTWVDGSVNNSQMYTAYNSS